MQKKSGVITRMNRILADHNINFMTLRQSVRFTKTGDIALTELLQRLKISATTITGLSRNEICDHKIRTQQD
jgi:hypothetical protein